MTGFPRYLSIQTTSMCNAGCIFCPYRELKDLFPARTMEMGLYRKIMDECGRYRDIERIILYMNNEPLTDRYLIERINYAKDKVPWACVHILTNGSLLNEDMASALLDSKLDWIGISFHGIRKEAIEKSMGIPFEATIDRIERFIEKAAERKDIAEYVMITFLRHKYLSDGEKEEVFSHWKERGIKRISFFEGPVSRAGNVKDLARPHHKEMINGCRSIWADEMIHIVEDGKVVLCCMDWRREAVLGDLNSQSIYEIWNNKRREAWQTIYGEKGMASDFLCKRCEEAVVKNYDC